jgi:hypothetical protein
MSPTMIASAVFSGYSSSPTLAATAIIQIADYQEVPVMPSDRVQVPIRMPKALLRKIDGLTKQRRRELAATWSRNDQIVTMLTDAAEKSGRDDER